ncbi:hypothetical protein SAMN02799630_02056 [Paenibacillus sp. UNCCL117]|uniref:hypothetical protein n=1 Tax=unclassified Paenibacillus TaxID=185978 RepID=UPI000886BF84|nr:MULTISPECIES: hypothetical protein [unclassified Paenibacillus]SDD02497.1 hypothetical protein SAMN04488602_10571 [Paenibacillus sp. cl123]SFW32475.1 hypothetical protein SAMN02799630_02056 [Paenibacillus sp. UNCCL117]
MQKETKVGVLVAGATFAGLGLALSLGEQALVVERTGAVGAEFTAAFRPAKADLSSRVSTDTAELREEAVGRNIVGEDGGMHWPAFVPVLQQWIHSRNIRVRFLTRIVEVKALPGAGFEVTLLDAAGLSKVRADRLVDTTSFCETEPAAASGGRLHGKRLNAIIHRPDAPQLAPPTIAGYPIHRGRFNSEWAASCQLSLSDDWFAARTRLLSWWDARPEELQPWRLAAIADGFDAGVDGGTTEVAEGWAWHPSAAYADPFAAFEAGVRFRYQWEEVSKR